MLQGNSFSGQPVFSHIVGLINESSFKQLMKEYDANGYCKRCGAWEHFLCMLYCIMNNCTSLREVIQGIATYGDKLNHVDITYYTPPAVLLAKLMQERQKLSLGLYMENYTAITKPL